LRERAATCTVTRDNPAEAGLHTQNMSDAAICLALTSALSRTQNVEEIYEAALDALQEGLGVHRASILLFDPDQVMRFKAWRGLSEEYRRAVEGHTPWTPTTAAPQPIFVSDVSVDGTLAAYLPTIRAEGIAAMTFVPLVSLDRVIGKFMLYFDTPRQFSAAELTLAGVVAAQVAFALDRTRAEEAARRSEERLRFALDAAMMGTWEWDLETNEVRWSENLEAVHGLPRGTFDGTFASYEREIFSDDHDRVMASARRALETGAPHEVEYRIVAPDGTIRWVEGKGRVNRDSVGKPVRMTGVCMNVTRRKQAEIDRLGAAQEASRLKDEFLAVLSHELRTPLNAIVGWVQMLQNGGLPPERARKALDVIARNARLQSQLIEDMLDVSRIITGQMQIERAPVFLSSVLDQVVIAMRPAADAKGVAIRTELPGEMPPIEGDARRLHQVLTNIVSNAVKFTPAGGSVSITCAVSEQAVTIEVRDTGIGIAPEFLPHVFERFRQADSTTKRQQGGLGLGLAIAEHLVLQHGGRVSAASDGPQRGATFTLEFPTSKSGSSQLSADDAAAAIGATAILRGIRALVVDDDADARQLIRTVLEQQGAEVAEAASGTAALAIARQAHFDLLLADIAMPGMDGYELIAEIKRARPSIAAVAVSAPARPGDYERALEAGYAGVETKPIDIVRLVGTAAACLSEVKKDRLASW
jgi:PAS domain S-box-containing protein